MWAVSLGTLVGLMIILYSPLNSFLKLSPLSLMQFIIATLIAVTSVAWYELVKVINYIKQQKKHYNFRSKI